MKSLKYKQQLYFYKFLIEGSHTWQKYSVVGARLEFVEPDENGNIYQPLEISFDEKEETDTKKLIISVWNFIKTLDFPDTSVYSKDYKGTQSFINHITKSNL